MELKQTRQPREKSLPVDTITVSTWRNKVVNFHQYQIADKTGLHEITVRTAINKGIATKTTVKKLNDFFNTTA